MEPSQVSRMQNRFTLAIGIGLLGGIVMGLLLHFSYLAEDKCVTARRRAT